MEAFKTILIPVDFTVNTEVAVCKAFDIAGANNAVIHLLYICKPSFNDVNLGRSSKTEKEIGAGITLNEWKISIEQQHPAAKVICWIESSLSVEEGIIEKSLEISPDLIVIGKTASHSVLPMLNTIVPSRIAKKAGCAVLTAKPGSMHRPTKHVVVPINVNVVESKINIVAALCKKNRIRISLVTFVNDKNVPEEFSASLLLQSYQRLKAVCPRGIEYAVLHGQNKGRSILQYAEENQADILLLEPYTETKIGWPGKHISDLISPDSRVQVLAV